MIPGPGPFEQGDVVLAEHEPGILFARTAWNGGQRQLAIGPADQVFAPGVVQIMQRDGSHGQGAAGRLCPDAIVVDIGAAAPDRVAHPIRDRIQDPARLACPVDHQTDHDRERMDAFGKILGAIERIDDPDHPRSDPVERRGRDRRGFLAHHAGLRQQPGQCVGEQGLAFAIDDRDGIAGGLFGHLIGGEPTKARHHDLGRDAAHQGGDGGVQGVHVSSDNRR